MKKLIPSLLAGLLFAASAQAQGINNVPQVGTIMDILRRPTYSAVSVALVPAAAATDIFCIAASATKNVSVRRIAIGGTAGTAITTPFVVLRRATVDTGGTAATGTALPVYGTHTSSDPASVATLVAYTANPTITDSSPVLLDSFLVDLPVTTAAGGTTEVSHLYGTATDMFQKGLNLLAGGTQQLCINLNGVSVSSGVLQITIEWQEQ